jgi:thimet oligopeptidase
LSSEASAAHLVTAGAEDLSSAADAAIANARDGVERLKSGELSGRPAVEILDLFDETSAELSGVHSLASMTANTHPEETVRSAAEAAVEAVTKVMTDISLDPGVYQALEALDVSDQDEPTQYYVSQTLREFRRSGVDRDEDTRERLRALNEEMTALGLAFQRNINTDTRTLEVDPSSLEGLPDDYVKAHPLNESGKASITTDYPDLVPFMIYSRDSAAREALYRLDRQRAYPANNEVLSQLLTRRFEYATLLGYASWAEYVTEDKMIGSESAVADFIARISEAATDRMNADYAELLARKQVDDPSATTVDAWDRSYLSDRLKAEKLAFDTQSVRPYFEYSRVKAGVMGMLERTFGLVFTVCEDVPVWHEDVEAYDVIRASDQVQLGRIFLDMHPRAGKFNHAACFPMTTGKDSGDPDTSRLPECALVCNLPKPGDSPALLQHSDVNTFFHEFGHLIHHVVGGHQRWAGISGIRNEWDFVEAPSQLLEEWTFDASTLSTFATHHETGEPLPEDSVVKLREADEFGKGLQVRQQMFYAALSHELHRGDPSGMDMIEVERSTMERHTPFRHVPDTYMHLSFGHLEGYSATYYTYMWSLVIAKDLWTRFEAEGLPAAVTSAAYRDAVLKPGGSKPAAALVRDFLGRDYTFEAYRAWLDN